MAAKPALLDEHKTDRTIHTRLSDNVPGYETKPAIADETGEPPTPVRYGLRTLDRAWIIPDKRVINRPNPALWQVRTARHQVFLTALERVAPNAGPAVSFTPYVPDLDHHHGRGGRAWPLWLDSAATRPNVVPGLLAELYGQPVEGPDLFAYIAAVAGHPGYVARYRDDLSTPGLRVPITSTAKLFERAVDVGRRVIWLHTFGERYSSPVRGRSGGPPRAAPGERPRVVTTIPDTEENMPETIEFDASSLLIDLEPEQLKLMDEIASDALVRTEDLTEVGILPIKERPVAEQPPRQSQL